MRETLIKSIFLIPLLGWCSCNKASKKVSHIFMFIHANGWYDDVGKTLLDKNSPMFNRNEPYTQRTLGITVPDVKNTDAFELVPSHQHPRLLFIHKKSKTHQTHSVGKSTTLSREHMIITDIIMSGENYFYSKRTFLRMLAYYAHSHSIINTQGFF